MHNVYLIFFLLAYLNQVADVTLLNGLSALLSWNKIITQEWIC